MEQLSEDWIVVGDRFPGDSQDSELSVIEPSQKEPAPVKAWHDAIAGAELDWRLVEWVVSSKSAENPWTRIADDIQNGLSASDCKERWQELSGERDLVLRPALHRPQDTPPGPMSEEQRPTAKQRTTITTSYQEQRPSTKANHTHDRSCKPYHSCMWTTQEDNDLEELYPHTHWIAIAKVIGNGRTPRDCRQRCKWLFWQTRRAEFEALGIESEEVMDAAQFSAPSSSSSDEEEASEEEEDEPAAIVASPRLSTLKRKASRVDAAETQTDAATRRRFHVAAEALSIDSADHQRIMADISARGWNVADLDFMEQLQRPPEPTSRMNAEFEEFLDWTGTRLQIGPFHGPMQKFFLSMKDSMKVLVLSEADKEVRLRFFRVARALSMDRIAFRNLWRGVEALGFRVGDLEAMEERLRQKLLLSV